MPPELAQPLPRKCDYPPRHLAILVALAGLAALCLWQPIDALVEKAHLAAFKSRGVAVEGVVVRLGTKHIATAKSARDMYSVDYAYTVGAGAVYRRYVELDQEQYQRLKADPRVPVIYDAAAPRESVLAFEQAPYPGDDHLLLLEGMYVVLALLAGSLLLIVVADGGAKKQLLMHGGVARARFTSITTETGPRGRKWVRLTYIFEDARGKEVVATESYDSARAAQLERCATVLFDPRDSMVNALYPLRQVKCRAVPRFL